MFNSTKLASLYPGADGREAAKCRALTAIGTLGILENAAMHGLIDLPRALTRLQATTFRARRELFAMLLARDAERQRSRP
jgi:predicted nucleic acid-binding protein